MSGAGEEEGCGNEAVRVWERIKVDFEIRVATRWGRDAASECHFGPDEFEVAVVAIWV